MRRFVVAVLLSVTVCAWSVRAQASEPAWCHSLPHAGYKALKRIPADDGWFEVYEVAPQTFAIYEPRQSEGTIGYLIVGTRRAVLFDTGMGISDMKAQVERLTKLPVAVLNSHTHADHVGGNWQFRDVYAVNTEFTRKNALGSTTQAQEEVRPSELCGTMPPLFDAKAFSTRPWKISHLIHDGEKIDLGGREIEIIATPGHTPDAICLFDRAQGLLFTGDTFYPGTIYLWAPETDLAAYETSIRKLAALTPQVKEVLGAHDFPLTPPEILPKLLISFDAVQAGKIKPKPAEQGRVIYKSGEINFLMRAKQ